MDQVIREFIRNGNDPKATMLSVAIRLRNKETVSALLEAGADVNIIDQDGNTPLSLALASESPELVELLLQYNPDFNLECVRDKFYACLCGASFDDERIVKAMVKHGFQVKKTDLFDTTRLWSAILLGLEEIAIPLIRNNLDFLKTVEIWYKSFLLHKQPFTEMQAEMLKIIVKIKDLFMKEDVIEWTGNHNLDLFKILLSESDIELMNVNVTSMGGSFSNNEESDIVAITKDVLLLCYNGNYSVCDQKGRTGLHYAANVGNIAVIQSLLDMNVDINILDKDGETALDYAYNRICEFSNNTNNDEAFNNEKQYDSEFKCSFSLFDLKIGALVLLKHISKLITLNSYITFENLKAVKLLLTIMSRDEIIMPYYVSIYRLIENSEEEINLMKKKKLAGISYYDFLTKKCDKIMLHTKREEVVEAFHINDSILQELEIYGPMLQYQFQTLDLRRGLIENAETILFNIMKWRHIPLLIVREILSNFSNDDLFFLVLNT